jgi:hypothetical protein
MATDQVNADVAALDAEEAQAGKQQQMERLQAKEQHYLALLVRHTCQTCHSSLSLVLIVTAINLSPVSAACTSPKLQ